jgi:hypothetical protein
MSDKPKLYYKVGVSSGQMMTSRNPAGYYESPDEAEEAHQVHLSNLNIRKCEAKVVADKRLDELEEKFYQFMQSNGCSVSYSIDGDTHGIHDSYLYISVDVDGFNFERRIID